MAMMFQGAADQRARVCKEFGLPLCRLIESYVDDALAIERKVRWCPFFAEEVMERGRAYALGQEQTSLGCAFKEKSSPRNEVDSKVHMFLKSDEPACTGETPP